MTITAQVPRSGPFTGNGSTVAFTYGFLLEADTELVVVVRNTTTNIVTTKILTTNYSVDGVGTVGGGTVTFVTAPTATEQVAFLRAVPMVQDLDLQNRGVVSPELLEAQLDELTRITQDHGEAIARAVLADVFNVVDQDQLILDISALAAIVADIVTVAGISAPVVTVAGIAADVTIVAGISGDVVSFSDIYLGAKAADPTVDNRGNPLVAGALYTNTTVGEFRYYDGAGWDGPEHSSSSLGTGVGDGTTTAFAILNAASSLLYTTVFVDGVYQNKAGFSVSGSTLTFSEAPPLNAAIETISYTPLVTGSEFADVLVTGTLSVDTIAEETAGSGVTIDSVLLKDGQVDGRDVAGDGAKLDGIEALADVTDATNVAAAGALMDSEVTNLAQVKAFDTADYATAAQGSTADTAIQPNDSPTLNALAVDTISEKTAANGVAIDGVTLKDGDVVLGNGKGIDFSATAGAGTSELLDDYEEGTWTPNLARFSGGAITATYSARVGYYTKVGNIVTLTCYVIISSISAQGSSVTYISDLPFSPIRPNDAVGVVSANSGFDTVEVRTCIANDSSRIYFRTAGNGAGLASPNFLAGGEISLTLQYMTS